MSATTCPDQVQGRNPHYVNHEDEMRAVKQGFSDVDGNLVVVISGVPGSGKTATARELAFQVKSKFPDGNLLVQLGGRLGDDGAETENLRSLLIALGEGEERLPDRLQALQARLQARTAGRRILLLIDGAVRSSQVRMLLPGDGRSLILVTASSSLFDLAVDRHAMHLELSPLTRSAAVDLMRRLVGAEAVGAEAAAVDEMIELCGHLPLALCVAASVLARRGRRSIEAVVTRLRDDRRRLPLLSPETELSVGAVFTAAFNTLGASAQRVYLQLGLAPRTGQVTAAALAAVLDRPLHEVIHDLENIADRRLIEDIDDDRYSVPDLVALHAATLDDRPEPERRAASATLIAYYHQRTYDADALLASARPWRVSFFGRLRSRGSFEDAGVARAWLDAERAALTVMIGYAAEQGDLERVCSWCVLLWPYYESGKHIPDLLAVHAVGIEAAQTLGKPAWESLLSVQKGFGHHWVGEYDTAVALFETGAQLAREAGSQELEATAIEGWGLALLEQRTMDALALAQQILRRNLRLACSIGDPRRIALARLHSAKAEPSDLAIPMLDEAIEFFVATAEPVNRIKCETRRGVHLVASGRAGDARPLLERAVVAMSERGRVFDQAEALVALGDAQAALGGATESRQSWSEALTCYEDLGFDARASEVQGRLDSAG